MPAFVQTLLTGQSKTADTSFVLSGSKVVTAGNYIFLAFASDNTAFALSVADNLGNMYQDVKQQENAAGVLTTLWLAGLTQQLVGGTLTSITVSWTGSTTAKAGVSAEFSGLGERDGTYGESVTGTDLRYAFHNTTPWQSGDLLIGALGWQTPGTDDITPGAGVEVAQEGTTGGLDDSNITVQMLYAAPNIDSVTNDSYGATDLTRSVVAAGAGAVYSTPVVQVITIPTPLVGF